MGKSEELQEVIYSNLCILKLIGHQIDCKQGMFKERSKPGFEAVGYALLMIIAPTECKNNIPWPLIEKSQAREFRTNFAKMIKMINSVHSEARIPEITASSLQFPGGINFLRFMYRLSTFALELELKKVLGPQELSSLALYSEPSTQTKDKKVKLKMVQGACCLIEEDIHNLIEYKTVASSLSKEFSDTDVATIKKMESTKKKLENEISLLNLEGHIKTELLDIEAGVAIAEYNKRTKEKVEELENTSRMLCKYQDLAAHCIKGLLHLAVQTPQETECLDGHKFITRNSSKETYGSMFSGDEELSIKNLMEAGKIAIDRLIPATVSTSQLQQAQDLKAKCYFLTTGVKDLDTELKTHCDMIDQDIQLLKPLLYSQMEGKKMLDCFKYLEDHPKLNFQIPVSPSGVNIPLKTVAGKRRPSLNTIIRRKKTIVCSLRSKPRELKGYVSSTPFLRTPVCRKSLYKTLPAGPKHQGEGGLESIEVTPQFSTLPSTLSSSIQESVICEPSPFKYSTNIERPLVNSSRKLHCARKSLDEIVQRFLKLKRNMSNNNSIKNKSDLE